MGVLPAIPVLATAATVVALAAGPVFTDATKASGIEFRNVCGAAPGSKGWLNESMGAGAAWLDYDGDGKLDLYLVNGSTYARGPGEGEPNRLFQAATASGRFSRRHRQAAGVGHRGWAYGVAVGDIDNDGRPGSLRDQHRATT